MPEFDYEKIAQEAERRFFKYTHVGVRGQTVTEKDGPEYWYALVAHEFATQKEGS